MQYKVINSLMDMKFLRNGKAVVIKAGTYAIVSAAEYQFLGQVYGLAVKGELVIEVRVTRPVVIEEVKEADAADEPEKKRKRKKR